jgi:hypothetical protein
MADVGNRPEHTFMSAQADPAVAHITSAGRHSLEYVRGSAALYSREGRIARLPDDIIRSGGLILKNVGSPPGCWDCDLHSIRFIEFSARVE